MSEQIQFTFGINSLFRVAKCVNTPSGYYLDIPAAKEDAKPIDGSDTLVATPEILIVTKGAFELQVPELGTITLHAGDIASPQRFRGPLKVISAANGSEYTCLTPRDGSIWEREAAFVSAGESIQLETPQNASQNLVFVSVGGLSDANGDHLSGSLIRLSGNETLTGITDCHFVHLWKV